MSQVLNATAVLRMQSIQKRLVEAGWQSPSLPVSKIAATGVAPESVIYLMDVETRYVVMTTLPDQKGRDLLYNLIPDHQQSVEGLHAILAALGKPGAGQSYTEKELREYLTFYAPRYLIGTQIFSMISNSPLPLSKYDFAILRYFHHGEQAHVLRPAAKKATGRMLTPQEVIANVEHVLADERQLHP